MGTTNAKGMQEQDTKIKELTQLVKKLQISQASSEAQVHGAVSSASLSSASLNQNVPNPLTNSTSISYTLPVDSSKALLTITNNNGNAVKQFSLNAVEREP